jgi:hypothetical protein
VLGAAAILLRMSRDEDEEPAAEPDRLWRRLFLLLNLLLLAFCTVAWINARATFSIQEQTFAYRDGYIKWLPTTYDAALTRDALLMYAACFAVFWGARFWLMRGWRRAEQMHSEKEMLTAASNRRLKALLWVLSLNGALLALQGILQRLSGSSKLLWLRQAHNDEPSLAFGPFSYRGNAAEYLNLIWPLALAFWWLLSRERRRLQAAGRSLADGPELLLVPGVILMAAASVVTLSRGGALVCGGLILGSFLILAGQKGVSNAKRLLGAGMISAVAAIAFSINLDDLVARFSAEGNLGSLNGRTEISENARQIVADYPLFGSGPGSFRSVYHLYRENTDQLWHGFLHDDWLETLVTFGWIGSGLILAGFVVLLLWIRSPGKAPAPPAFLLCSGLALGGLLLHAKFDFPMQTYSIFFTFVLVASLLTTVSPSRQ